MSQQNPEVKEEILKEDKNDLKRTPEKVSESSCLAESQNGSKNKSAKKSESLAKDNDKTEIGKQQSEQKD